MIFSAAETDQSRLVSRLETALSQAFQYEANVVLRSRDQLRANLGPAPSGFGSQPDAFRYDVIYLKEPLRATEAMQYVLPKEGVDLAFPGEGVLYFSRLISKASQSRLSRIVSSLIYHQITIRN